MSRRTQLRRRNRLELCSWNCFHSALVPFCQLFAVACLLQLIHIAVTVLALTAFSSTMEILYISTSAKQPLSSMLFPLHTSGNISPCSVHILFRSCSWCCRRSLLHSQVRAFQPTQHAAGCIHCPGLQAPLPATPGLVGATWESDGDGNTTSDTCKSHSNMSCLL